MTIVIEGQSLNSREEAVNAAIKEANAAPVPLKVINCFTFLTNNFDKGDLKTKAMHYIDKEFKVSFEYHEWKRHWWYVPVPTVKYIRQGVPHLNFRIDLYIAARAEFTYWSFDAEKYMKTEATYPCTYVGKFIGEIAKFDMALVLAKSIADGDFSQYEVVEKDRFWTTWDVNGFESRIPDTFIPLMKSLKGKPMGKSLEDMKIIGFGVGHLLEKSLTTMTPAITSPLELLGAIQDDHKQLIDSLEKQMGYSKDKAEAAANYVTKNFPQMSLEEKKMEALIYLGMKGK